MFAKFLHIRIEPDVDFDSEQGAGTLADYVESDGVPTFYHNTTAMLNAVEPAECAHTLNEPC